MDGAFLGTWSALTVFGIGSAVRDAYKFWKNRTRKKTDYERVIDGETIKGWTVVIPYQYLCKNYDTSPSRHLGGYWCCRFLTTGFDRPNELIRPSTWSIFLLFYYDMPNGNTIYMIRRYSLVQPRASVTVLKIVCDGNWQQEIFPDFRYLTSRTLMIMLRSVFMDAVRFRVVLFDPPSRKRRSFVVECAVGESPVSAYASVNESKWYINVLFSVRDMGGNNRIKYADSIYELPDSDQQPVRRVSRRESPWFDLGDRSWYTHFNAGYPLVAALIDHENIAPNSCVVYDPTDGWKMVSMIEWMTSFRKTGIPAASTAFASLSPPSEWYFSDTPTLCGYTWHFAFPAGHELFSMSRSGGILRRTLSPPPLTRLAAETLFRAYPDLELSAVEKAIGFNISDGIPDQETVDDTEMMYL